MPLLPPLPAAITDADLPPCYCRYALLLYAAMPHDLRVMICYAVYCFATAAMRDTMRYRRGERYVMMLLRCLMMRLYAYTPLRYAAALIVDIADFASPCCHAVRVVSCCLF